MARLRAREWEAKDKGRNESSSSLIRPPHHFHTCAGVRSTLMAAATSAMAFSSSWLTESVMEIPGKRS